MISKYWHQTERNSLLGEIFKLSNSSTLSSMLRTTVEDSQAIFSTCQKTPGVTIQETSSPENQKGAG